MSIKAFLEVPMMVYAVGSAFVDYVTGKIRDHDEKKKRGDGTTVKMPNVCDVATMLKTTRLDVRTLCLELGIPKWTDDYTFTSDELQMLKDHIQKVGWVGHRYRTVTILAKFLDVEPVVLMAALKCAGFAKATSEDIVTEEEYAAARDFALLIQKDRATEKQKKWEYQRQDRGYYQQPKWQPYVDPAIKAAQELLGVNDSSTEEEITKAFRRKAFKAHPDHNPAGEALMIKLDAARKLLLAKFK